MARDFSLEIMQARDKRAESLKYSSFPLSVGLLPTVSVTYSQPQSENIKFPQPLTLSAGAIQTPILSWFNDPFLMYGQKVNSSLTQSHNAYIIRLTSSHPISISSSHTITRLMVITGQ